MENSKKWSDLYQQFQGFTMVWEPIFCDNLKLCQKYHQAGAAVVECGVWRGGMIAAIASVLEDSNASFHLFDSFKGLPDAREIDGKAALNWQADTTSPIYYNNCTADLEEARQAMSIARAKNVAYYPGWFSDTLKQVDPSMQISILRLDADWYDSTLSCLVSLYPLVLPGGLIVIDDYYTWDGCCRAVHDYLSSRKLAERIKCTQMGVAYIIKSTDP